MTLTYDTDLQTMRAMVMIYSHAKIQGQWSVGFEDRVKTNKRTDRWTEAIALPPFLIRYDKTILMCAQKLTDAS